MTHGFRKAFAGDFWGEVDFAIGRGGVHGI